MTNAPERIWASTDLGMVGTGRWETQGTENPFGRVEYVRADIAAQAIADEQARTPPKVTDAMVDAACLAMFGRNWSPKNTMRAALAAAMRVK